MTDKPNIVFLFTDQQCADAMSCAGSPHLRTPAMDRLAAMGVRFENAYCSYPLCVPSRMSMLTGRMPHELGMYANCFETQQALGRPTLGTLFRDAGYETHWTGKWHLTIPEAAHDEHGFGAIDFGGGYGDTDGAKADRAIEFLKRDHDAPFLLVVSLNNPHDCCEWSRGDELRMGPLPEPPDTAHLPPLPSNYEIPADEPDYLRTFAREYENVFPSVHWTEDQARRYLWGYNRLVEMVDAEISRILDALSETGHEDDTIVVFSSDHGDGAARHQWNQKFSLYDESAKVPFVVCGGAASGGRTEDRVVSAGLDLLPTLCDYASIEPPKGLPGRSVRALAEGQPESEGRTFVAAETSFSMWGNVGEDCWPKARMIRTQRYKYVAYDAGDRREQLIDMQDDPGEMVNLAGVAECSGVLESHRRLLAKWCEATDDSFSI